MKTNYKIIQSALEISILAENYDEIIQALFDFEVELREMSKTYISPSRHIIKEILGDA